MRKRPYFQSLRGKITNRALFIGLMPILILGPLGYLGLSDLLDNTGQGISDSREKLLDEVIGDNLADTASIVTNQIDDFMLERISDVIGWASVPAVVKASAGAAGEHAQRNLTNLSIDEIEDQFSDQKSLELFPETDNYLKDQVKRSPHFGEIFITDANGLNVSLTNPTSDFVQRDESWWTTAFENGISLGGVEFDNSAGIWSVDVSVRITDSSGRHVGVMKAVLGVSLIQEISDLRASEIRSGNISVVNNNGELLAETRSGHASERIMNPEVNLKNSEDNAIESVFGKQTSSGYVLGDQQVIGFSESAAGDYYSDVIENFPGFNWTVIVEQPTEVAFSPIAGLASIQNSLSQSRENLLLILTVALVLMFVLTIIIASLLSKGIIASVRQLQELAERLSRGDTKQAIELSSNDEIADLAQIFDRLRFSLAILFKRYRKLKADPRLAQSPPPSSSR